MAYPNLYGLKSAMDAIYSELSRGPEAYVSEDYLNEKFNMLEAHKRDVYNWLKRKDK